MTAATADAWIAAWEAQAAPDSLGRGSAYWQAGWERRRPTDAPGASAGIQSPYPWRLWGLRLDDKGIRVDLEPHGHPRQYPQHDRPS
jgi:hypothetical protein